MRILLASIYPYVFLLLYLTIPFDEYVRALPNILLIILIAAFPLIVTKDDFRKLKRTPTLIFLTFFVVLILNMVLNGRIDQNLDIIEMTSIAIGLAILYIPVHDFKKIHKAIILSCLAAITFSVVMMVVFANTHGTLPLGTTQEILDVLLIDRLYLGLLCVMSILISFHELKDRFHPRNKYLIGNIVLTVLFLFFIVSRVAILILIVLLLVRQLYGTKKIRKLIFTIGITTVVFTAVFAISETERARFLYNSEFSANTALLAENMIGEPRFLIWDCAKSISDAKGLLMNGLGFNETNERLVECYKDEIQDDALKQWFLEKRFNTHNQFLDFYLSAGLIVFLLFAAFFVLVFLRNRKYFYPTAMLLCIVIFGLAESYLHRQIGAYYFGFILITLLIKNDETQISTSKEE